MTRIIEKRELVKDIHEMVLAAPLIAAKAQPGHFVLVMPEEKGERIPLTIADYDRDNGTITLIFMVVGTTTMKLSRLNASENLYALVGPLGHPSEIEDHGTVAMVAGGIGTAPIYPIARSLRERGNRVISIQGARREDLLFWTEQLASVSDEHIITTDDGSFGRKGLVSEPLKEILENDKEKRIGCVYAIGPAIMMKFCSLTTKPFGVKTITSLNSVMVDGTGMCGGCRVNVGGKTLFTCVDGPEFDGHLVDWDLLMDRQKIYLKEEKCSLDRYMEEVGGK
ncbi:MAG: sulfide/dihydroorotate dehydrogenase-like FAD/NAD-binding protein [Candidatus Latescibacteria bacterium]|nr:sulfide/dihydroorotate dehydrogenase-like FAD/NAD-binding protein [Candidatus Latescibacterota bacterium]NIM21786.1 sulfide/dihydroorotate dehydrogenase-like FAD/NAD-binding protein [Candidatus Latescibacterota bacterium]NIM65924.1 sulfide/dihydroorotate dehydrogenase-like FAD/NAD-binding protein [Candidatus Latescibacterota bacterium]NIO02669.1 sulfide/dihydroorotate dehydrogenase-like FAD/NAD-binding protein [Candidatus Latescibacterota bacterium]NIO29650.1 sulfide/dihydroorotate dehydroge